MKRDESQFPGVRNYPPISAGLLTQLEKVPSTTDGMMVYRPCKVTLQDGSTKDYVYVVQAADYIKVWGVWPDQDHAKREVSIQNVSAIAESPSRLPPKLAQTLYDAGESGMGYVAFEISYKDGSRSCHLAGNAVDFVLLPKGMNVADIAAVHPHEGREKKGHLQTPEYSWCLYEAR